MGKGSRNRDLRGAERYENPAKNVKKKPKAPMPKWLKTTIAIALVVAIVFGVVAIVLVNNGFIQRNRILVESKSGKFDVNQQMATYIAWYNLYQTGVWYYNLYAQMGSVNANSSPDLMGLSYAMELQNDLRSGISGVKDQLLEYVALCDAADASGMTLSEEDLESIDKSIEALWALKKAVGYAAVSEKIFLEDYMAPGMKEKDIRAALELMALANKYALSEQSKIEKNLMNDTTGKLVAYRDANLNKFYSAKYLSYTVETEADRAFVESLAALTTPEAFKEAVLKNYFDNNYKGIFNKYTTQVTVEKDFSSISGKQDTTGGTAWTDAVGQIDGWAKQTYVKEGSALHADIQGWLFNVSRAKYDSVKLSADGQYYVITIASIVKDGENVTSVEAYIKSYADDAAAMTDYDKIADKKDIAAGNAWSEAVAEIEGLTLETYQKATSTLPQAVKDWLFANDRNAFHTQMFTPDKTNDNKFYLVTVKKVTKGAEADDVTVEAYIKTYENSEGESYGGDDAYKTSAYAFLKYLMLNAEKPTVDYKTANEKANALKEKLTADGADVEAILGAVEGLVTVKAANKPASIPAAVTDALKDVKAEDVGKTKMGSDSKTGIYYLIYVDAVENANVDYRYASFESDMFRKIVDDLEVGAEKVVPTEKSVYADVEADAEKSPFAAWISELTANGDAKVLPFIREKNQTAWFTEKVTEDVKKDDGTTETKEKTVYSAYIIVDTMKYDTESTKIHGGYLKVTGDNKESDANKVKDSLKGKTYAELIAAFYSNGATTSYNSGIKLDTINDEEVKAWFESADRTTNEIAVIDGKDGNKYVVVFIEKLIGWESDVKTDYVTETCKQMVEDLKKDYTFNEKKLEKIPTAETTTAAAA